MHCPSLPEQALRVWLGALHQLALADGDFDDDERQILADNLAEMQPEAEFDWHSLPAPESEDLVKHLAVDPLMPEQFLRTAIVVAMADGHLSNEELDLIKSWAAALGCSQGLVQLIESCAEEPHGLTVDALGSLRKWLDGLNPHDPRIASFIVHMIPAQCPFERDIKLFGHKIVHIPAMCQINPIYDQLVGLRFRCLEKLSQEQQMRISRLDSSSE